MIKQNNIFAFERFSKISNLVHGFSTREFGSMRSKDPLASGHLQLFAQTIHISPENIVKMDQVHGNQVRWVDKKDCAQVVLGTDGLVTEKKNVFLVVLAGDCMPVLFYHKKRQVCAAAHAGWKGMYHEVIPEVVKSIQEHGSNPEDILVGFGPCIRSCCYSIGEDRVKLFTEKRGDTTKYLLYRNGKTFLDIPQLAREQLLKLGILEKNIEDSGICTFESTDRFYSYRKEGKEFGEFVGIIGMK